ncbi:MAG: phosphoribosylamine--glycine ligase [Clostridia bacterium]|nr:phosphoribosylamine--glycine ligase [Clostridia bacterium]
MKILMVGGGGREHALIMKLLESPKVEKIYCAPGNGGISDYAECFDVDACDIDKMTALAKDLDVDLVFVAPDDPLAIGMTDALEKAGFRVFGPNKAAAEIESSKIFSKNFMKKYNIPTAEYEVFEDFNSAKEYIENYKKFPIVLKADGLALGKGVLICKDKNEALDGLNTLMIERKMGKAGDKIVAEEFLSGPEVSVLAFTDGKTLVPMMSSKDHKRALDNDRGLNTGGMGTISPNPYYTKEIEERCFEEIFIPTMEGMNKEGRTFKGCLYFGLMLTENGPKVIEYNSRFGDPEAQVVLPMLKTPLIDILDAVVDEKLDDIEIENYKGAAACVMVASGGYPEKYEKGYKIDGLSDKGQLKDNDEVFIYHSGTKKENGEYLTNGGRVLGVASRAENLQTALDKVYYAIKQINFDKMHYRKDIGK